MRGWRGIGSIMRGLGRLVGGWVEWLREIVVGRV